MGNYVASDNAATTLAASITNSPTVNSITVADASKFPVVNHGGVGSDWSYATLFDASNNMETVKVTRRDNASNTLSIVRGTAAGISGVTDVDCRSWTSTTTGVAIRLISQIVTDLRIASEQAAADAASAAAAANAAVAGVKITDNDTTADKLDDKITVAGGITKSVLNSGGNEQLQFSVTFPVTTVFGRAGAVTLQSGDVTGALGYTPFNFGASTPWHSGNFDPSTKANLSSPTFTGNITVPSRYHFTVTAMSLYAENTNNVGVLNTTGGWASRTDNAGNFTATANVTAYSDERLKKNWRPMPSDFIERLARIRMGIYDRTDQEVTQVGVGAQSLQQLLPEAVLEGPDGTLGVAYGNAALAACVALAAEAVALRSEVEALKANPVRRLFAKLFGG